MKRRDLMVALGATAVAAPTAALADSHGEAKAEHEVTLLFVQSAHRASLADGRLELMGVNPSVLFFSDRPDRVTGHVHVNEFVDEWDEGDDSFAKVPPNAVLSFVEHDELENVVVVLKNPRLRPGSLIYDVEVLEGHKQVSGEAASLFIDVIGRPLSPMSIAGVHRRHRRRRRRRMHALH